MLDAHDHLKIPFDDMRVISVGNGEVPDGVVGVDFNQMFRAQMLGPIMDMMFAMQSELADRATASLLHDKDGDRVLRVNVTLNKIVELDDVDEAVRQLKPLAERETRTGIGKFMEMVGGEVI